MMKKMRFILAMVLVLAMLAAAPLSALAATWEAETSDDVLNAFTYDTDAEVVVNLKNDINMDSGLATNNGQSYTINGNGHTIADVYLYGDGSAAINADVTSVEANVALEVSDKAQVTVNGDVTGADGDSEGGSGATGVYVYGDAQVTVNGDVTGGDTYGDGFGGGTGVYAEDNAQVTVNGDVTAGDGNLSEEEMQVANAYSDGGDGVFAGDNAQVTVDGDVTAGDSAGTYGYGGDGVVVYDKGEVSVTGDVTGGDVTADPDVEAEEYNESYGGDAVYVANTATVSVGGNAVAGSTNGQAGYGGDGIYVTYFSDDDFGSVTVDGTAVAGSGGEDGQDGYAINMYDEEPRYEASLEEALAATPEELLEELLAARENGEEDRTMYYLLEEACMMMLDNGDLTPEELEPYQEKYQELVDQAESEEEEKLIEIQLYQQMLKNEASSTNILELSGYYMEMNVGAVKGQCNSLFGAKSTQQYAVSGVPSSTPNTGEAPTALILSAMMIVSLLGMTALMVTRKKHA